MMSSPATSSPAGTNATSSPATSGPTAASLDSDALVKAHKLLQIKRRKPQRCLVCDMVAYNFCTGCHLAYYCCRTHQLADWGHHRIPCHFVKRHPELRLPDYVIPDDIATLGWVAAHLHPPEGTSAAGPITTAAAAATAANRAAEPAATASSSDASTSASQKSKERSRKEAKEKEAREKEKEKEKKKERAEEARKQWRLAKKARQMGSASRESSPDNDQIVTPTWLSVHPDANIAEIHGITEHAVTNEKFLYVTWKPPHQTDPSRCTLLALRDAGNWKRQVLAFLESRVRVAGDRDTISSSDWKQYPPTDGYAKGDTVSRIHGMRFRSGVFKTPYFLVTWSSDNAVAWIRSVEVYAREPEKALAFFESRLRISSSAKIRT